MSWPYAYCRKKLSDEVAQNLERAVKNVIVGHSYDWGEEKQILCFSRPLTQKEQTIVNIVAGDLIEQE
jgi:hypothetical protein